MITNHNDRAVSQAQINAVDFLQAPPLSMPIRVGYRILYNAAVSTIPDGLNKQLGIHPVRRATQNGRNSIKAMRWALGASPSWQLALIRCNAPIPPGVFRQPLPQDAFDN